MCIYVYIFICIYVISLYRYTRIHVYIHTYIHTYVHARTHTHTLALELELKSTGLAWALWTGACGRSARSMPPPRGRQWLLQGEFCWIQSQRRISSIHTTHLVSVIISCVHGRTHDNVQKSSTWSFVLYCKHSRVWGQHAARRTSCCIHASPVLKPQPQALTLSSLDDEPPCVRSLRALHHPSGNSPAACYMGVLKLGLAFILGL